MRFGRPLKDAAYNPFFSISYRKGFWRSIDVLCVINIHWWCLHRREWRILWWWRFEVSLPASPHRERLWEPARVGRGLWRDIILWEVTQKHSCKSWVTLDLQERFWLISHRIMKQIIGGDAVDVELCRSAILRALVAWGKLIYFNAFTVAERNLLRRNTSNLSWRSQQYY